MSIAYVSIPKCKDRTITCIITQTEQKGQQMITTSGAWKFTINNIVPASDTINGILFY